MWIYRNIRSYQRGLLFQNSEFVRVLGPGKHLLFNPLLNQRAEVQDVRPVWLAHRDLDVIVKSGKLNPEETRVLDLKDDQRALIWIDGRLRAVTGPGLSVMWTVFHEVRVEVIDAEPVRFAHKQLNCVLQLPMAKQQLDTERVEPGQLGRYFLDGEYAETGSWCGLRHRQWEHSRAKAAGNSQAPHLPPPRQRPTLPGARGAALDAI